MRWAVKNEMPFIFALIDYDERWYLFFLCFFILELMRWYFIEWHMLFISFFCFLCLFLLSTTQLVRLIIENLHDFRKKTEQFLHTALFAIVFISSTYFQEICVSLAHSLFSFTYCNWIDSMKTIYSFFSSIQTFLFFLFRWTNPGNMIQQLTLHFNCIATVWNKFIICWLDWGKMSKNRSKSFRAKCNIGFLVGKNVTM